MQQEDNADIQRKEEDHPVPLPPTAAKPEKTKQSSSGGSGSFAFTKQLFRETFQQNGPYLEDMKILESGL